ncbi:hypothetical protein PR048_029575 [Dryococelus australis]|uniref:SEP domain-containing protein n=1 Tax=Dryococelus australis TaxID=614101 RepID=A0ABQ9GFY1_9NEOP|nr:hypothetical protein PR048_029575 [Dryococelus australis]
MGTMLDDAFWLADFLWNLLFRLPLHSSTVPYSPRFTLISSRDPKGHEANQAITLVLKGITIIVTFSTRGAPDFDRLLQQISELNLLAGHGKSKLVHTSNGATFKSTVKKKLRGYRQHLPRFHHVKIQAHIHKVLSSEDQLHWKISVLTTRAQRIFPSKVCDLIVLFCRGKTEASKPLSLTLYADGLILESGPFLPYTNLRVSMFLSDILDGYFPSDLQLLYPEGVPFIVVDRHTTRHGGTHSVWTPFCGKGHSLDCSDNLKEAVRFGLDARLAELIEAQNVGGEYSTDMFTLLQGRQREECSNNVRHEENLTSNQMKVRKYSNKAVEKTIMEKDSRMKQNCNKLENHLPSLHRITQSKMSFITDASTQTSKSKHEVPADDISTQHCNSLKTCRVKELLRCSAWLQKTGTGGTALSKKALECNTLEPRQTVLAKFVTRRDLTQLGNTIRIKVLSTDGLTTCIICSLRPDQRVRELRSVLNLQAPMVDKCGQLYKLTAVDEHGHCVCLRDSQPLKNYGIICNSLVRMCVLTPPMFSDERSLPSISRYTNGYWYRTDSQSKFLCSGI